jgi:hypothetical protein
MGYLLSSSEDTAASRTLASRTPRMNMSIQGNGNHGRRTKRWYRQWGYVKYGKSRTPSIERKCLPVSEVEPNVDNCKADVKMVRPPTATTTTTTSAPIAKLEYHGPPFYLHIITPTIDLNPCCRNLIPGPSTSTCYCLPFLAFLFPLS